MTHRPKITLPGRATQQTASAIRERLDSPGEEVDLRGLAERWQECQILWTIQGHGQAIGDPGLPGRIRGAFGEELLARASAEAARGDACPWDPPCTFEILFKKQGRMEPGLDYPGPWVIELDAMDGNLIVIFKLFGFACDYAAAAAESLTYALMAKVDYAGRTGFFFQRPVIVDRTIVMAEPIDFRAPRSGMILDFVTPATLTGNTIKHNPRGLITTAAARLSGLARWHDVALHIDREALVQATRLLDFEWIEATNVHWQRGSSRQEKSFRMGGIVGRLVIAGEMVDLSLPGAVLTIGERTHIGADVAFGCGRFELTPF